MSQFRNSPILNIEIHDRDERADTRRYIGSVFGSENTDETIGKVSGKKRKIKIILSFFFLYIIFLKVKRIYLNQKMNQIGIHMVVLK